jgi:omega-6 fatty acid desaturase (delta-12 desaturase)
LEGSSYYLLPRVLQWITANVGFHHVHHYCPRIPNYRLQECMESIPELQRAAPLTLRESLGCWSLKLWNVDRQAFETFPE